MGAVLSAFDSVAAFIGTPIYVHDFGCDRVQVRFPRSKKRRIRKKWAKRSCNWVSKPIRGCYQLAATALTHACIICDRLTYQELQRMVK